jgi:hypothetical protein
VSDRKLERWARASGAIAGALAIAALVVAGKTPGVDASAAEITDAYVGNRGRLLAAILVASASLVFLLWFIGALASILREAGMGGWAATILAALTARAGLQLVIVTLHGALAYKIAENGDEAVVQGLRDVIWALGVTASLPIAVVLFASALGLSRAGIAPAWYRWAGLAGAAVTLAGGTTWARDGFWAPDGLYALIVIAVALAWMFVTSTLLLLAPPSAPGMPQRSKETVAYKAVR